MDGDSGVDIDGRSVALGGAEVPVAGGSGVGCALSWSRVGMEDVTHSVVIEFKGISRRTGTVGPGLGPGNGTFELNHFM